MLLLTTLALLLWPLAAHGTSGVETPSSRLMQSVHPKNQPQGFELRWLPTVVNFDGGGVVIDYDTRWRAIAAEGGPVEVRGMCWSACTLLTAHIPRERLCFAEFSSLNFHMARDGTADRLPAPEITQWMYYNYPHDIQDWIDELGGVAAMPVTGVWTLPAKKLWEMGYRKCD